MYGGIIMKIYYDGIVKTGEYGKYIQLYNNPHKFFISVRENKDALALNINGRACIKGNLTLTSKGSLIIYADTINALNNISNADYVSVNSKLYINKYGKYIIVRRNINGQWNSYFIPVVGGTDSTPDKSNVSIYGSFGVSMKGKLYINAKEITCI